MAQGEVHQRLQRRDEFNTDRGQRIADLHRHARDHGALNEVGGLQLPRPQGERSAVKRDCLSDGRAGGELRVVAEDSKSVECHIEVRLGGPAGGRVLRQGTDQGERLSGRDVGTGPTFALGPIP